MGGVPVWGVLVNMTFLGGSNPILTRELRVSLRSARAFVLLAIYVAVLGTIVLANFPGGSQLDVRSDGGAAALNTFGYIVGGQALLILAMLPALATGALAQERERQTLEPLLLSPLTPLQIVWGKAGGVLSLVGLLMLSTLPLTSLCFLLGGVDPGILVLAYSGLVGLAIFTTCLGLYCSARWKGATQSMLICYTALPVALIILFMFSALGSCAAGFLVMAVATIGFSRWWRGQAATSWARRLKFFYRPLHFLLPLCAFLLLGYLVLAFRGTVGYSVLGIGLVLSYLVIAAQWTMLQTAKELVQNREPELKLREKVADFREELRATWASAPSVAESMALAPGFSGTPSEVNLSGIDKVVSANVSRGKATYGVVPFLSDKLNPIYARELRAGVLGKFEYLFKFAYGAIIFSQVALLILLLTVLGERSWGFLGNTEALEETVLAWGQVHCGFLLILASWFGARSIAPEREGQTLMHLFTLPLRPHQIIYGKMAAVLTFTMYAFILMLAPMLVMGVVGVLPLPMVLRFLAVEGVLALLAASWGICCSFHMATVRRAITNSIGGVLVVLIAGHWILTPFFSPWLTGATFIPFPWVYDVLPMPLLTGIPLLDYSRDSGGIMTALASPVGLSWDGITLACLGYVLLALLLLAETVRNFKRFAQAS